MKKVIILAAVLAGPAIAEDGPSFDCAKVGSSAEELICADPELAALDREMAAVYQSALGVTENLDAAAGEATATLKAMQRGWIKGRDECWKSDDLAACVRMSYLQRTAELTIEWMLTEPYTEAAWRCGDTPANEVYVMYFDTALPAIRVEYGDGVAAMMQSSAASGTRYDGSFGRYFWEKGGEATFVWDDSVAQDCVLVAG